MEEMNKNLMTDISKKLDVLGERVEKDFASKKDLVETVELVKAFQKEMDKGRKAAKQNRIFGNEQVAQDFVEHLAGLVDGHRKLKSNDPSGMGRSHSFAQYKTAANATTSGQGAVSVPTSVSDQVAMLVTEYGVARKLATVNYFTGNQSIITLSDDATAAYTTNDTTDGTDTLQTFASVSLTPKQMIAIYRASGKLLYNSAVDVAEQIMNALVRAVARLEDKTMLFGDGTATYGSQTGIEDNTSVPVTSVASLAAITLDDLITIAYQANEVADESGEYYINRALVPVLRKLKASTAGTYHIGFQDGTFDIGGKKVNVVKQMHDGLTHGDMVAFYGLPSVACRLGVNRDMKIDLDESVDFVKGGLVWRAIQDFGFAIPQPTALAKLRIGSASTVTT